MFFDWMIFALPGILFGFWAQFKVQSAYRRASQIPTRRGMTGAQAAFAILDAEGVRDVAIEPTHGVLSDHYHPLQKKLRLSEANYGGHSIAAVGVSAHEAGHALQHARRYAPLMMRSALVPVYTAGTWLAQIAVIGGFLLLLVSPMLGRTVLFWGILGYAAMFLFALVTLPVELNASKRALQAVTANGIVTDAELPEVKRVLDAAALTYVAAAVALLGQLLYLLSIFSRTGDE